MKSGPKVARPDSVRLWTPGAGYSGPISVFRNLELDLFLIFRIMPTATSPRFPGLKTERPMQYFVVMIDYGRRGREAIVVPKSPGAR